jgi:hypothetical protein
MCDHHPSKSSETKRVDTVSHLSFSVQPKALDIHEEQLIIRRSIKAASFRIGCLNACVKRHLTACQASHWYPPMTTVGLALLCVADDQSSFPSTAIEIFHCHESFSGPRLAAD